MYEILGIYSIGLSEQLGKRYAGIAVRTVDRTPNAIACSPCLSDEGLERLVIMIVV